MAVSQMAGEHVRIYWTRVEVCDKSDEGQRGYRIPESEVLKLILAIPGVQLVYGGGYKIQVHRSGAFSWDEIDPKINEILAQLEGTEGTAHSGESEGQTSNR